MILGFRSLCQNLISIEAGSDDVSAKNVDERQRVARLFDPVGLERLDQRGVFQDDGELRFVGGEFGFRQRNPGQSSYAGYIDVNGSRIGGIRHEARV